jgi:beta-mannosidase
VLRGAWETARPDVPYLPDNPTGGALPSHVDEGASHWFGVGAYLRPLDDARRSRVRFAAECLAFANVPEQDLLDAWPGGIAPVAHPAWKAGVPRDASAGWDFDDVRDHYFELLVGERPERVRAADPLRYLDLSRLVTGEVMEATLSELRTNGVCAGALVLAWADLVPGAGWGLLDARGVPKAAYWLLARALRPVALLVTDEGLNGFHLHAVNDGPAALGGRLEVALVRGEAEVAAGAVAVTVPARGRVRVRASEALGRFTDETYAHRFGPPPHDALVARLRTEDGAVRSEVVQLVGDGRRRVLAEDPGLTAAAEPAGPDAYVVRLSARRLAYGVRLEVGPGCAPEERYVHVAPGVPREVRVRAAAGAALAGEARPLAGAAARFAAARGGAAT